MLALLTDWSTLSLTKGVAYRVIADQLILWLSRPAGTKYFMADGIVPDVVQAIKRGVSRAQFLAEVAQTYDVDLETLGHDSDSIVDYLIQHGVVQVDSAPTAKQPPQPIDSKDDPDVLNDMYDFAKRNRVPFKVFWELTYRCDHQCRHCYLGADVVRQANLAGHRSDFPTSRAFELLDEMAEQGVLELVVTGGEASLHPDFPRVLEAATERGFAVNVLTNGAAIPGAVLESLTANVVNQVRIPLYGNSEVHNDFVRDAHGFERSLQNARYLKEHGVHVVISSVLTKGSLPGLLDVHRTLTDIGLEHEVSPLIFPTIYGSTDPAEERASDEETRDAFTQLGIRLTRHQCVAGISRFRITPQGDVNPCEMLRGISYGNVLTSSFDHVMKGASRAKWIEDFERMTSLRSRTCAACSKRSYCVDCMGLGMLETGNPMSISKEACRLATLTADVWGGVGVDH